MDEKLVRYMVIMSIFLGMALFAGCGKRQTLLTGSDDGSIIELSVGDTVAINLESNPTTGYSWQVVQMDGRLLQLQGEPEYQANLEGDRLVGAPGTETYVFKALGTGQTTLVLGYFRPWEEMIPPVQTFTVQFLID